MERALKKIAVLTSGGDSPGMNAAIRSVVRTCAYLDVECMAVYRGYQGMIEGDFVPMNARSVNNIINKGGTSNGSMSFSKRLYASNSPSFVKSPIKRQKCRLSE